MIACTDKGRNELHKCNWKSHWNSTLGWICLPSNINEILYIRSYNSENSKPFWALQDEYWEEYDKIYKTLLS